MSTLVLGTTRRKEDSVSTRTPQGLNQTQAELIVQRDELVRRLNEGDRQIQKAKIDGANFTTLETLWIRLLRQYEAVCNAIGADQAEQFETAA